MSINIALADDKAVNRRVLIEKLKPFSDVNIVIEAVNGDDFLEQVKSIPLQKMPRVAFIDLEMPGLNGIQTIGITKALYPEIQCIVLTVFEDDDKIFEAIKAGAAGYLLKDESKISVHDAIMDVIEFGGAPMSPGIARKIFGLLNSTHQTTLSPKTDAPPQENNILTDRENEILNYTINGWDAKRISVALSLSVHTVRNHIASIYRKLHVTSRAQIIQLAYKNKWIK